MGNMSETTRAMASVSYIGLLWNTVPIESRTDKIDSQINLMTTGWDDILYQSFPAEGFCLLRYFYPCADAKAKLMSLQKERRQEFIKTLAMFRSVIVLLAVSLPHFQTFRTKPLIEMRSAHLGSRVILSCNSSSIPKWYHNKKRLAITRQEIVLENVKKSNRGLYTCKGMDSAGKNTVKTFRLVVISKEDRIIPKHVRAPVGGKAKFRCTSGLKATFTHNHDVLPKNSYVHESTLHIYNVIFSNGGKYICSGLDGSYLQFVAEAYLIVEDKKMISPMQLTVCQYCTAKFSCRSETLPKWLFNGRMIPSNAHPNNKHLLNIYSVESYNEGYYECLGTTPEGYEFSSMAYLRVIFLDKHRVVPHYQEVYVGQRALINCNSSSPVYWKFNETASVPSNTFITGRALNIPKTKLDNAGLYYCVSNDVDADYHFYSPSELIVLKKRQLPKMKNGSK